MNNDNKPAAAQEAVASVISYKPLERTAVITWAHVQNGGDPDWLRCGAKLFAAPVAAALVESPTEPIGGNECPVTGLPFYDSMEHPERGMIAMYGGPFDVYSIPELGDDDELRRERYDLDADNWVEGGEPLGYFYREQQAEAGSTPAAPGIDLHAPCTEAVYALARKLLWIAYVWNDHNFDHPYKIARKLAEEFGIESFDQANSWLDEQAKLIDASPKGGSDWEATDADIAAWVARNDLGGSFGSKTDARAAFEDARSAEQATSAEVGA